MGASAEMNINTEIIFFGAQMPATKLFTGRVNRQSPAKKVNPE